VIAEASHAISLASKEGVTPRVSSFMNIFDVLTAIDLDHQFRSVGNRIDNVWSHGRLSSKAHALQTVSTECVPDDALCRSQFATKPARAQTRR
jgi:hypothetical protein